MTQFKRQLRTRQGTKQDVKTRVINSKNYDALSPKAQLTGNYYVIERETISALLDAARHYIRTLGICYECNGEWDNNNPIAAKHRAKCMLGWALRDAHETVDGE